MEQDKKQRLIMFAIIMVGLLIIMHIVNSAAETSTKYNLFAQCISKSGTTFYGSFSCPHCQAQKRAFGAAKDFLPYVECSNPDGSTETPDCISKGIQSYPTWEFADGTRLVGEQDMKTLSEKTNCPLP